MVYVFEDAGSENSVLPHFLFTKLILLIEY